ncbi:MAG: DUF349 domain-containing protein, partial [Bifidobacterium mongoliense]|nr:DUF349 domain-containing protein [Bifidobacterium mongoliense]
MADETVTEPEHTSEHQEPGATSPTPTPSDDGAQQARNPEVSPSEPAPTPAAVPAPHKAAVPMPHAPSPAAFAKHPTRHAAPTVAPAVSKHADEDISAAKQFGHVDESGAVFVREGD